MDTKHTPGPWTTFARLSGSENHKGFYVVSPDDWLLCDVMPVDQDGIEGEANAHLIAAAPELLEALREIHNIAAAPRLPENVNEDWPTVLMRRLGEIRHVSQKAIGKAEGR